jgi:hypothetical protein
MKPAHKPILRIVEVPASIVVGRYARADATFAREQSAKMKYAEWESRMKPMRTWCQIAALFIGFAVFMAACVFLAVM